MTNAEIDMYIVKLYKEAEALAERDELRKKNNDDLKKAWKRFLKNCTKSNDFSND